jgi:hypothetical protein
VLFSLRATLAPNVFLSPFLFILPSGNVFAGYYNEARILDKTTFQTTKVLPNMPGTVNDFLAGRTYPVSCIASLPTATF